MPRRDDIDTRARLIEAAGQVFAEFGFNSATVREICRRARANIAAVNYHFGDKESLYAAVLRHASRVADAKYPPILDVSPDAPAEERLSAYIRSFLRRMLDPGRPTWHGMAMTREMVEPTPVLADLVRDSIRPRYEMLLGIVRELLGPDATDEQAYRVAHGILGQCLYYHQARNLLPHLVPEHVLATMDVEHLAAHIVEFSLGGIRAIACDSKAGVA